MDSLSATNPLSLLKPLRNYIVEDLSNADSNAASVLAETALQELAVPVVKTMYGAGAGSDDIGLHFFADPDDPTTPGNLYFWPLTRTSRDSTYDDAHSAEYSLRASIFLSERDDNDVIYPPGISLVLKLQASACELVRNLPAPVFQLLEGHLRGSNPKGLEFLDDSQHLPLLPGMRSRFLRAIERAHQVTAKSRRPEFEAVMLHYIWDETEPVRDFSAVLATLTGLFVAIHQQAKISKA